MSCNHLEDCQRCGDRVFEAERENERLIELIKLMKEEFVQYFTWGKRSGDALNAIEHLIACALDPAPGPGEEP